MVYSKFYTFVGYKVYVDDFARDVKMTQPNDEDEYIEWSCDNFGNIWVSHTNINGFDVRKSTHDIVEENNDHDWLVAGVFIGCHSLGKNSDCCSLELMISAQQKLLTLPSLPCIKGKTPELYIMQDDCMCCS